jgi:hypothetical protein
VLSKRLQRPTTVPSLLRIILECRTDKESLDYAKDDPVVILRLPPPSALYPQRQAASRLIAAHGHHTLAKTVQVVASYMGPTLDRPRAAGLASRPSREDGASRPRLRRGFSPER